ncbi:MAG: hypothetical protein QGD93_11470, partial [Actinomycetota bacterium]|nr:hypothetical protein [Actinomycetota bacterium]
EKQRNRSFLSLGRRTGEKAELARPEGGSLGNWVEGGRWNVGRWREFFSWPGDGSGDCGGLIEWVCAARVVLDDNRRP